VARYSVVFYEGCWRIQYRGFHLGEFASADVATEAAVRVINSRVVPGSKVEIKNGANGEITIGDPEESA
jgi:hypothetical protein